MSSYISDVGSILGAAGGLPKVEHSTARKANNTELDMTDFLNLMVVQLQNQTIDNTMDTSDMLNQMVQMQMITALTNMTDASVMSYASSLVGKEVTIGDYSSGELEEKVVTITGSGVSNGKQVLFAGDDIYDLSSVMAVGRLPKHDQEDGEEDETGKTEGTGESDKTGQTGKTEGTGQSEGTDKTDKTEGSGETEGTDKTGQSESSSGQTGGMSPEEREMDTLKRFLLSVEVPFSDDITIEELNELVDEYFRSIQGGEGSNSQPGDANAQALQAAQQLLKANRVNMAEDSTEEEILKAAEAIRRSGQPQAQQDADAEKQPGDGKAVEAVSGGEAASGQTGGGEGKDEARPVDDQAEAPVQD